MDNKQQLLNRLELLRRDWMIAETPRKKDFIKMLAESVKRQIKEQESLPLSEQWEALQKS